MKLICWLIIDLFKYGVTHKAFLAYGFIKHSGSKWLKKKKKKERNHKKNESLEPQVGDT